MRITFRAAIGMLLLALAAQAGAAGEAPAPGDLVARGRALYRAGRRADGSPLVAGRTGGLVLAGAEAACVACHRRSGMGGAEGRSYIPPVTAAALFTPMPAGKGASAIGDGRPAYAEASLARALREGVDASGRHLDYVMPRYRLDDQEVRALHAYLRTLPQALAADAGAQTDTVHFATVIAPGVPAQRSEAMLGVLQACFDEHNAGPQPERGRRKLAQGMEQRAGRPWQLHVWRLQGPQEGWEAQLARHASEQPVFALVGGVGGAQWAPVHGFCEGAGVPCLFPHLEAAPAATDGFYPIYLGKGALLEAALVARYLAQQPGGAVHVTQVLREHDASAKAAAAALRKALATAGATMTEIRIPAGAAVRPDTLAKVPAQGTLVLWLRPDDLQRLGEGRPAGAQVFVSATLAGRDEVPLPPAWKERALMAYPYELPQQRTLRTLPMRQWLAQRGLPLTDERVQGDAYVACKALRTAMLEAEDHFGRDYFVERVETDMERSNATGLYPSLALGIGQRFAAKTGYLVRFEGERGGLAAVGERIAP
ncbi:MAG TPA: c-type cytochrome [Ramlibacter sp.]|uniref:c-type cytochrome n=1 Tax=Ramlibacter sp. TaxID=1917967 RepID=UPI002D80B62D|nr:c-type cytochrome [Ramlibacter sp.]HET8748699.1 c-type cytochrome [Ramlibacter sp.]